MSKSLRLMLSTSLLIAILTPTTGFAREKREPIAKYKAQAMNLARGGAAFLDIVIYEWTTPEDRMALIKAFQEGGNQGLYDHLDDQDEKGFVRAPHTLGYEMRYAYKFEHDGMEHIVMGTDRPLGFLEVHRNSRISDYNISFIYFQMDPETGEGSGTAMGGAEFKVDEKTGGIVIEHATTQVTKLNKITMLD